MKILQRHVHALMPSDISVPEGLAADLAAASLVLGADGVMVPIRPAGGQLTVKTRWHEINVGVQACLG